MACISITYGLPLLYSFYASADFTALTNESLAYRYFAIDRVWAGENGNIWLPQGQLTTALQHLVMAAIEGIDVVKDLTFRERLNAFAYLTAALNVVLVALLLLIAVCNRSLDWGDRALIAIMLLVPIYGARTQGLHSHLVPDYLPMSVILLGLSLLLILMADRARSAALTTWDGAGVGILLGLLLGNKITLLPAALLVVVATAFRYRYPWSERLRCGALIAISTFATILLILLVIYRFDAMSISEMAPQWYRFVLNPGAEPDFWNRMVEYVRYYFGYGVGFATVAIGVSIAVTSIGRQWSAYSLAILCGAGITFIAGLVFVARRPAQTTFFEVFCLLIFVSATLVGTLPIRRYRLTMSSASMGFWILVSIGTFPVGAAISTISSSRAMADERWTMFQDTIAMADRRQILIVFPTNEFHHLGVHELLLKASARFPTWYIDAAGQAVLDRFSPNTRFFHEYNAPLDIESAIQAAAIVVWFDRIDLQPIEERYPSLNALQQSPAFRCEHGDYHNAFGAVSHIWWRCLK